MKYFITMLVFMLLFGCSSADNLVEDQKLAISFTKLNELSPMPEGRFGIAYTTDGNNIFSINGSSFIYPLFFTDIQKYDVEKNEWKNLPVELLRKRYSSAQYYKGKIYIFGGSTISRTHNPYVEVYDVATGKVSKAGRMPLLLSHCGSAVWNGKIYIFGGSVRIGGYNYSAYSDMVMSFDPETYEWEEVTRMRLGKEVFGEIVDEKLFLFGGYDRHISYYIDIYNLRTDKWTKLGTVDIRISANAIAKHGKFIWLAGSYYNGKMVAAFDTKSNKFYLVESNLSPRRHAGMEIVEGKMFVFGGLKSGHREAVKSIQVADISKIERQIVTSGANEIILSRVDIR